MARLEPGRNALSLKMAAFWKGEIESVDKAQEKWFKRGSTIIKRFRDERGRYSDQDNQRKMNLLWTTIKIMKPALLSKCPVPIAERKFLDRDPIARLSASMLQRSLRTEIEDNGYYKSIERAVLDYLLPGRGQVWIRYEPEFGTSDSLSLEYGAFPELDKIQKDFDVEIDDEEEDKLEDTGEDVVTEKVMVDYVDWRDFYMFPAKARTWDEVQAIGKKVYLSKKEAIKRFGKEIGEDIKPDTSPSGTDRARNPYRDTVVLNDIHQREIVGFEIWNKTDRRVYWISTGYDYLCDVKDDPLGLKKFFPTPEPISSTLTNDTIQPVADYMEWQDQALQIDELTQRLALLTKACKVAGTYDASNGAIKRLLDESVENQLIPVDSWAMYAEKGGVAGGISFLPLKEIQSCIETLTEVRREVKQDLDEVTGLSDILRGTTDSRETLGGLRLKNNNAGTRLSERQNEVAAFAKEVIRITAEIMSIHFDNQTFIDTSGILFEESMQPDIIMADFHASIQQKLENDPRFKLIAQAMNGSMRGEQGQQQLGAPQGQTPQGMGQAPQGQTGGNIVPFSGQMQDAQMPPQNSPLLLLAQNLQQQMEAVTPEQLIDGKIKKAIELIRKDLHCNYRIDIEVDSTIYSDQMQERQDAVEFIESSTKMLSEGAQLGATMPEAIPLLAKLFQFGVKKFRVGRELESSVDIFVEDMVKKAKHMIANPQVPPEMMKVQAEMQKDKQQAEMQAQNDQRQAQIEQSRAQQDAALEKEKGQIELALKKEEAQMKMQIEQMKLQIEALKAQIEERAMHTKMQADTVKHHQDMQISQQQHQQTIEQGHMQHQQAKEAHSQEMHSMHEQSKVNAQFHTNQMQHMNAQHKQKMAATKDAKTKGPKAA